MRSQPSCAIYVYIDVAFTCSVKHSNKDFSYCYSFMCFTVTLCEVMRVHSLLMLPQQHEVNLWSSPPFRGEVM